MNGGGAMGQQGFTLLEVLVALAIAATALMVMVGRLGASADVQRTLSAQALMLDTAIDVLDRSRLAQDSSGAFRETDGRVRADGLTVSWKSTFEPTVQPGLVRQNVEVSLPGEPQLRLFRYRLAK